MGAAAFFFSVLLSSAFVSTVGFAQEGFSSSRMEARTTFPASEKTWDAFLTFDAMAKESRLNRQEDSHSALLRSLVLGLNYRLDPQLNFYLEGSAQSFGSESEFFISQAYAEMHWDLLKVQAGQLYYPVGWLTAEDTYFLNQPFYYQELYKGKKGLDLGVVAQVFPFKNQRVILEASCFEGRVFRVTDERQGAAEKRPCSVGVRSHWSFGEAFATHFEQDLAFYDPVTADGIGLRLQSPLLWQRFSLGFWGEAFQIKTTQQNGPTAVTTAGFAYPHLDWGRWRVGYRFSPADTRVNYSQAPDVRSKIQDSLLRAEVKITKPLSLIYEDERMTQDQGIDVKNEWALRLLLQTAL